jgi:iron(III) transport system substrate-binding protein
MTRELVVYSGRNRPDLAPVYRLYQQLTDTQLTVEKVYHWDVEQRVVAERSAPRADILLTNSQLALETMRHAGVFDPYPAAVARDYPEWLRAPDYTWLSFTAWPRVAMINRSTLGDDVAAWPHSLEDLCDPRFEGQVGCASSIEATTIAQFAAIRVARGDTYAEQLLDRLRANGLRIYRSNLDTREAVIRESLAAALANSSNVHVFYLEGNPVGEAWLDQQEDGLGTHVEAHTVAILKGCKQPEAARDFIDFVLSPEIQSLLARLYGETPVNPNAEHGWVRPLSQIQRTDASIQSIAARLTSTLDLLRAKGFELA